MAQDQQTTYRTFKQLVNMPRTQIERWLKSGVKIITILAKKKTDLTDDDYQHMKRVNAYIKRHLAQRPTKEDVEDSRWRASLMNWGHDPLKHA